MSWTKEQEQAINEHGKNIIVSAGAGSGKTAVLTARTMRILNEGTHINELLILTFTKAAAGEMKERIRNKIKEEPKLSKELELIDQAYITTFDSFALSIVKKYHYLINKSNDINITEDSIIDIAKIKIMNEVFDYSYEHPTDEFTKLVYDFCTKDDKKLQRQILQIATKIDGLINREEYLNSYLDNYTSDEFINKMINEYENNILEKVEEIKKVEDNLYYYTDGDYETKNRELTSPLYSTNNIEDLKTIINGIRLKNLPNGSGDELKDAKTKLKTALDKLKKILNEYGSKEDIKNNIKNTHIYTKAILDIINMFLDKLHTYKDQNDIYDFQDIALLSIKILKDNKDVRDELKYTFKQIMIDEYQDTNDIQETFISMIENNNVYMVGDIKQSIYRFRNANPYIFKSKYDNYSKDINGMKIDLVKNFRSREEVLANINEIFNLIMDDKIGGAEYHESHQMVFGNTSYNEKGKTNQDNNLEVLEYHFDKDTPYTKEEIEIFTIAKDIKEKIDNKYQVFDKDKNVLRDITYKDFVILVDKRKDFDLYKKIFEYQSIPLLLLKKEKLNTSDDIYIIKNIIDIIIKISNKEYDTQFKYDYISIARSYLYNIPDQDIFNTFKTNNFIDTDIYKDFYNLSKKLYSYTITEVLEEIIRITNIYEKLITVSDINNSIIRLSKLLDIASNLSLLGYNIYTFKDYLEELFDAEHNMEYETPLDNSNSVKIMTIHTSKALEFHICYYSGLYGEFNKEETKDRFLLSNKYGIITPYFAEGIKNTIIKYLFINNYLEEDISERIRLFYVGLTRAKEKMIILTPQVEEVSNQLEDNNTIDIFIRKKYNSFADIMNSIKHNIIKYYKEIDINSLNITNKYLFKLSKNSKVFKDVEDTLNIKELPNIETTIKTNTKYSKESLSLIDKTTYNNMEYGTKIHEILEYIDFTNPDYSLIDDEFIQEKVRNFLTNPLFSNFKDVNIYNEYEFIYEEKNEVHHGIIDLLLEYKDKIYIVDYKLNNIKEDKYIDQLNGYKDYISKLSNKEVSIYLYSILSNQIEEL